MQRSTAIVHYHGTPITPREQLERMAGRHFCVSFAHPADLKTCLRIGQSVMFDNGAFSIWRKGGRLDVQAYYKWLEPILTPPHWCVIPDAIDEPLEAQQQLLGNWPRETFGYENAAPVFHLHMPLSHLHFLCNGYPKVCLGSSGEYAEIGTDRWTRRMDEIFNFLAKRRTMPWIHGLRMLGQHSGPWPMASADSTNVAQNFKRDGGCAECKAAPIDSRQPQPWRKRPEHPELGL